MAGWPTLLAWSDGRPCWLSVGVRWAQLLHGLFHGLAPADYVVPRFALLWGVHAAELRFRSQLRALPLLAGAGEDGVATGSFVRRPFVGDKGGGLRGLLGWFCNFFCKCFCNFFCSCFCKWAVCGGRGAGSRGRRPRP